MRESGGGGGRRSALHAFVMKELRHIVRDRQTLTILLLLPLAMVVLFGFALRNDINDVRIAIVDASPDAATIALRNRLSGNPRFSIVTVARTTDVVEPLFRRGAADIAVVFPVGFGESLSRGTSTRLLLIGDASDPNTASMMAAYVNAVIASYAADRGVNRQSVQIVPQFRMRYNPTLESVNLFVPGLIALVLMLVTALMTAISLSREKERGTLEILLVSPLRPWQIIVGKVMPYLLLAFANVITALVAAWLVFHVPFRGSVVLLLGSSVLFAMVGLALGVLIAALTSSQRAAMLGAIVVTMLPNTLLSGLIFPISSLPGWLRPVTYFAPARWFIVIARGIMLKGVGMSYLWKEHVVLVVMLLLLFTAAVKSFKARLA
ncbi:MAG TPA: ABC transporter permease [Gemmatimonadaceae bacterium]